MRIGKKECREKIRVAEIVIYKKAAGHWADCAKIGVGCLAAFVKERWGWAGMRSGGFAACARW